jgi:flagellar basal-body rod modification protein FlgD
MITATSPSPVTPAVLADKSAFSSASDFTMFLKMLTTQMQNQNPLNPVEAADFAVQLATFSAVEQQVQTNQLLARMSERGISGDLAAWLGTDVAAGTATQVGQSELHLHLPTATAGTTHRALVFKTQAGQEVMRLPVAVGQNSLHLHPAATGASPLLPGSYVTEVEDFADADLLGRQPAAQFTRVQEVQKTAQGVVLVLETGARADPADVIALRKP